MPFKLGAGTGSAFLTCEVARLNGLACCLVPFKLEGGRSTFLIPERLLKLSDAVADEQIPTLASNEH